MSIIYSYPEQSILNPGDMLIGTSVEKVGGKQKNVTKNFTIQQVADFINRGAGFVDPVATDFQIPVFNQGGLKITGSIMSQDSSPSNGVAGTGITIAGNLTVNGGATIGDQVSNVVFDSPTKLLGPILDSGSVQGGVNQILISNQLGKVNWIDYEAGLTYEGTWDAAANTTNGQSNSPALVQGVGVSGHFYIVDVEGTTSLGPGLNDWHVGDWAVFLDQGGQPASWQKIDNTSVLTGDGTAGVFAKWTDTTTLNDSLMSQSGTNILINGGLKVKDTVEATTTNSNLKLKGNGTGGIEIMSADGLTDGKITLNCSQNSHGVTLQSPPHSAGQSYTLVLPATTGNPADVLTSSGPSNSQLVWTTPTTGTVTGTGSTNTLPIWTNGGTGELGDSILDQLPTAGVFTDTYLSVAGSGGLSTQNLEINKALYDGAASSGSDGFVLTSATSGTDKVISWVDPTTIGDSYDLRTTTVGGNVELSLVSGSATDNSAVIVTGAGGITVTETQGANPTDPTTLTLTGTPGGVTSVGTADADLITIAGTGSGPYTGAVTATANTSAVSSSSNNLATGSQIQTAIDTALAGTLTFKGTFNAATGSITSGVNNGLQLYSGTAGVIAITQGDFYIADTAGSFYNTTAMNVGDEAIALFTVAAAPPGSAITDWSVVPAQSSGGTVTGTGAATQVTFWDGTSNVNGDTAFNWDNTNKRLGIGTTSPAEKLDVAGAIISTGGITGHGANRTTISQEGVNGAFWQSYGANSSTYGTFTLRQASSDFSLVRSPLKIDSAGNVGIGTTSPSQKLEVNGRVDIGDVNYAYGGENFHINMGTSAGSGDSYLSNINGLAILSSGGYYYGGNLRKLNAGVTSYSGIMLSSQTTGDIKFESIVGATAGSNANATVNMIIQSGGNVGIGTTTPSVSLDLGTKTDAIQLPAGDNTARAAISNPFGGMIRYNTTDDQFEGYSGVGAAGSWGAIGGGGGASTITTNIFSGNATVGPFTLGAAPSGGSTSFVDVFVDGVYQEITNYTVSGTALNFVVGAEPPAGTSIQTKTTSGAVSGALVSSVDIGQSSGNTGAVNLRIVPLEVTSGQTIPGNANYLYIFTATAGGSIATVTLPGSPTLGDSIKISNIGGLANVLGANGNKIMGQAANMTINTPTAAFEIIWSGSNNGWIIIGNV